MDRVRILIRSADANALRKLLQREKLDLNCGGPKRSANGAWELEAFVPASAVQRLRAEAVDVELELEIDKDFSQRLTERPAEVGKGDRFRSGKVTPRGIGRKE